MSLYDRWQLERGQIQGRLTFSSRVMRLKGTISLLGELSTSVVSCWMGWAISERKKKGLEKKIIANHTIIGHLQL